MDVPGSVAALVRHTSHGWRDARVLLLTDRLGESSRLRMALGTVEPCSVTALHRALDESSPQTLLVCDAALDNIAATELVRAALAHYRGLAEDTPVLCLTRDPSQVTFAQARAVGASAILPSDTHPAELAARVRQLIAAHNAKRRHPAAALAASAAVEASIREAATVLSGLFEAAHRRSPISPDALRQGADAVIEAVGRARIRVWLDVVWRYDDVTYQHCLIVAGLTSAFARAIGLSLESQRLLAQAALVHDIGKAHVPHAILTKPGRLSTAEMNVMQTHVTIGHAMLLHQTGFEPSLLEIVRHHHEYLDGSGYPDRLRGAEISQFVRMVTICDIYAALIERRSYKAPAAPRVALAALVDLGAKLDVGLVGAFGETFGAA